MKKLILSLTLVGALAVIPTVSCIAKVDSPNDKVRFKKISIEEISETSILVEDTITPKCKCNDEKCKEKEDVCPKEDKNKENKEACPRKLEESKKIEKQN